MSGLRVVAVLAAFVLAVARGPSLRQQAGKKALIAVNTTLEQEDHTGAEVCGAATLLTQMFSCLKEDGIPLFARHGLLLGTIREKSFINFHTHFDLDLDVGYLSEDKEAVLAYFRSAEQNPSHCFRAKGMQVETYRSCPAPCGEEKSCVAPSVNLQKRLFATASESHMDPGLKYELEGLCNLDSQISGFYSTLGGKVNGRAVKIKLAGSGFMREGDKYFYDMACALNWNCALEVQMWYARYKQHEMFHYEPGQAMRLYFPASAFKPLRPAEFVLSPNRTAEVMVPNLATMVLERLYGFSWRRPFDKQNLDTVIPKPSRQTYMCRDH